VSSNKTRVLLFVFRYKVVDHEELPLYTSVTVDVGRPSRDLLLLSDLIEKDFRHDRGGVTCLDTLQWMYRNLAKFAYGAA